MPGLNEMVQVNHKMPKWAKEMVGILAHARGISEQMWWDEAFRLKFDTDYTEVEKIFGLARDFVAEHRRQQQYTPSDGD